MGSGIVREKKTLREKYMAARERLSDAEARGSDASIASFIFGADFYREAGSVFVYIGVGREVDTMPIISRAFADGKTVLFPRTGKDRVLQAVPVGEEVLLEPAFAGWPRAFGIPEPPETLEGARGRGPDLVIAPSLVLDRFGYRLGYGGGFYDSYIQKAREQKNRPVVAAVQRSLFVLDDPLPREPYDMAVDLIVTENGIVIPSSSTRSI